MKQYLFLLLFISHGFISCAQDDEDQPPPGKVSAKIFANFNMMLNQETPSTAFQVRRAYFGYQRDLNKHFFAEVKLDIGSIDDISEFSLIRRYAYFKNAYLSYQNGNVKTWFGLFEMLQFKVQEKFWGYRYLYRSYMDEYRFGPSADMGAGIQYTPSKKISTDLIISNGEGYKNPQYDNIYKIGAGVTLHPVPDLTLRAYYTINTSEVHQMTYAGFIGYRFKKLRLAGEFINQRNNAFIEGLHRYGYSFYSTYTYSEKWELFARYDHLFSNITSEGEIPWNLSKDGSAIISGVQFTPIEYVHISLNYQDWVEFAANGATDPFLFLNFEIVF